EILTLPGGQVNDTSMLVGGVPFFVAGERVLLFLDDDSDFKIVGMWQGKYSLSGDNAFQPETGKSVSITTLEQAISDALTHPVEIGTSPEIVHAQFTTSCPGWNTSQMPVSHLVNPANSGSGSPSGSSFTSLMYDSLNSWQALSNSWIAMSIDGTTSISAPSNDGVNAIYWENLSGGTLGVNYCSFFVSPALRINSDTEFDNSSREWTITAEGGKFDLRSVAEHEFGHGIGLGHSDQVCDGSAATPLMCASISSGVRKTILTDDSNGAASLYGLSGSVPNAPTGLTVTKNTSSNTLNWNDSATNEFAFEIQRAASSCSGTFKGVGTVGANVTTYTDNDYGVGLNGSYCYRVKALNQGGDSNFSNAVLNEALSATKSLVSASSVITSGDRVTYTISVVNGSSDNVANTTVADTIPTGTTYDSSSITANTAINFSNFPTTTSAFTVNGNTTIQITYALMVGTVTEGQILTSTTTISAPSLSEDINLDSIIIIDARTIYIPLIY
ncbi:MAG: matrixin family metalloprotease, partial [Chloroflexota bacterium]